MKKIFALLALTIVMSVCCSSLCLHAFDSSNKTKIKLPDEDKVVSFTEDFLKKIYPDKNLKISESNYIYNKNDEINGYCYNLTNNEINSGYIIICRKGDMIKVSEYAIQDNINNPFDEIKSFMDISDPDSKYYWESPFDYGVWDLDSDIAYQYKYGEQIEIVNEYSIVKCKNVTNDVSIAINTRSGLDGYSVITDNYSGTRTGYDIIPSANLIGYYNDAHTTYYNLQYACGCIAACNIMKYYNWIGFTNIPSSFSTLYNITLNLFQPDSEGNTEEHDVVYGTKDIIEYFGYNCSTNAFLFNTYSAFKNAIADDNPCLLAYRALFGNSIRGHMVLVVGYTETTLDRYLTVADGWNSYLRHITFDGYDYDHFQGIEFEVSS